jgi:hypothetical protein
MGTKAAPTSAGLQKSKGTDMGTSATQFEQIDDEMVALLATKTETERLGIAWGMWRSARRMIERMVAAENPTLPKSEQERLVAQPMSDGT